MNYPYTQDTLRAAAKIPHNVVNAKSHSLGLAESEPLIVMMDCLLRYADAYAVRFERLLCEDGFLGEPWLQAAKGVRALLNGDGAIAMRRDITTDSKDNGAVEDVFWNAMKSAGFKEEDL